ncbi:hypothetical protein C7212DRAFT_363349 [Tuber magnatum]|uniref:Uncharacterized protein n=1 Tax=Tuber magnatum TaxID=42249 RepID=A0A317SRC2_9PEZI|nr:hypothetical protein C7212DRAFT_363349 [Tuber magnatum]
MLFPRTVRLVRAPFRASFGTYRLGRLDRITNHRFSSRNYVEQANSPEAPKDGTAPKEPTQLSMTTNQDQVADATVALKLNTQTRSEMRDYVQMMMNFSIGVLALGFIGGLYKFTMYDAGRDDKRDKRFTALGDKMDKRFTALDDKMDKRFTVLENKMDKRFTAMDNKIDKVRLEIGDVKKDVAELKGSMDMIITLMQSRNKGWFA